MPLIIKPSQAEQVRKLVSHCCNWDEGTCLLLEMPCPQQLSLTRINCRYFREAVLPAKPKALSIHYEEQLRRNENEKTE